MAIRENFVPEEWYHCYSRGIDKRTTFEDNNDYERFLQLLYLTNSSEKVHLSNIRGHSTEDILTLPRSSPLVGIGAFCLMTNHFHLLLQEKEEKGISTFMQRIGTSYSMYFNIKHKRSGSLFAKPFKSQHVKNDLYFQKVIQYIHCNPAEIFEPHWKQGHVNNVDKLYKKLLTYEYSSFGAFLNPSGKLRKILTDSVFEIETQVSPERMLTEAQEYYALHPKATP